MQKSVIALTEKAIRLRQAALMCWLLGWVATSTAVHQGLMNTLKGVEGVYWYYTGPAALIVGFLLQRLFTAMESGITSGELPLPWVAGWTAQVCLPWVLAIMVLAIDGLMNLSAAHLILNGADVGGTALGMADGQENGLRTFALIVISLVVALGSEILRMWADMIDPSKQDENRAQPAPEQQRTQPVQQLTKAQRRALHEAREAEKTNGQREAEAAEEAEVQQPTGDRRAHFRSRVARRLQKQG